MKVVMRMAAEVRTTVLAQAQATVLARATVLALALATAPAQAIVEAAMMAVSAAAPGLQISKNVIMARGWTSSAHLELYAILTPPVAVSSSATILAAIHLEVVRLEVVIHPVVAIRK